MKSYEDFFYNRLPYCVLTINGVILCPMVDEYVSCIFFFFVCRKVYYGWVKITVCYQATNNTIFSNIKIWKKRKDTNKISFRVELYGIYEKNLKIFHDIKFNLNNDFHNLKVCLFSCSNC